jgi:hypothetical protein
MQILWDVTPQTLYLAHTQPFRDFSFNPITGLDRPWRFLEVEAPRFQDNRHMKVVECQPYAPAAFNPPGNIPGGLHLKCDGTRAETRFRLSEKRTSLFKSAGVSIQSTTGSRVLRISGSNAGYTKFRGSVRGTGYPLHSPVSPSLPLPCATVCHHISTRLYSFLLEAESTPGP